jgi:hypothetical protein
MELVCKLLLILCISQQSTASDANLIKSDMPLLFNYIKKNSSRKIRFSRSVLCDTLFPCVTFVLQLSDVLN